MNQSLPILQLTSPATESTSVALRLDCRYYRGDRPCVKGRLCSCVEYAPMGQRILIIKLGALGDVIRTEALLPGLKDVYPQSHITWVSKASGCRVLANNPLIDRLLEFNAETICHLEIEQFDLLISLDKEPGPAALAMRVPAAEKRGIGLSAQGTSYPLNAQAHHYFLLGLSDELKFQRNSFSYQKLVYDALGLTYQGERYTLYPSEADEAYATQKWREWGVSASERIVGLNTGAGSVFANKTWNADQFVELSRMLVARGDCRVALLGGPEEIGKNEWIYKQLAGQVIHTGCHHRELQFAALLRHCSVVLTGDTTALHMAVALRVPVVALFGPTCAQEIDLYGRGRKLRAGLACSPCYRRHCDIAPSCMDQLQVEQVAQTLSEYLDPSTGRTVGVSQEMRTPAQILMSE
ncbi:MAG: hypothetical protein HJJLKODD_01062 [Phycisphaerae bacterium]|nr:hypothetical protein [Phycisphaerae bacterium]